MSEISVDEVMVEGDDSRKEFFNKIIDIVTLLGGDSKDVF